VILPHGCRTDDLGHHRRRSRVIWYPGSTPPYSSLWIIIQRFLMLNQPTRAAFKQDFLVRQVEGEKKTGAHAILRKSLNDYQLAGDQSPVRLTRLRRVQGRYGGVSLRHIGQIPTLARPYFCVLLLPLLSCRGFHSILYSFWHWCLSGSLIQTEPVQPDKLSSDFSIVCFATLSGCQYLQCSRFPEARAKGACST
jgi:hypothetical protein